MSTSVIDITPLVEAEASAAVPHTPAVGIPASDIPMPALKEDKPSEVNAEQPEVRAEKTEAKPEDAKEPKEPKALPSQKEIHETLKEFFKEATPEGKERLQKLNSEIRDLYVSWLSVKWRTGVLR